MQGLAALGVVVVAASLASLWLDRARATAPHDDARRAQRHAAYTSAAAIACLVGALLAVVGLGVAANIYGLGRMPGLRRLLAALPAAAGLLFIGAHAVGELTWPRPRGPVREAMLVARTARDVAPVRLLRWAWAVAALTLVAVGAFVLAASGPRTVTRVVDAHTFVAEPFPGTWFGVPVLVAAVLVVLASAATLRIIASRPAVLGTSPAWDMWLRRRSARRVLRGGQLVGCLTVAAMCHFAGIAWQYLGNLDASWEQVPHGTGYVAAGLLVRGLGLVLAAVGLVVAVVPARDVAPALADVEHAASAVAS